jgi:hypothetical protein
MGTDRDSNVLGRTGWALAGYAVPSGVEGATATAAFEHVRIDR